MQMSSARTPQPPRRNLLFKVASGFETRSVTGLRHFITPWLKELGAKFKLTVQVAV